MRLTSPLLESRINSSYLDTSVIGPANDKRQASASRTAAVHHCIVPYKLSYSLSCPCVPDANSLIGGCANNLCAVISPVNLKDCVLVPFQDVVVGTFSVNIP